MFSFKVGLVFLISVHLGSGWFFQNSGSSNYNFGHSNGDQSKDISHNGGDTDQSRKCDHPDKRDHVKSLLSEWHKHRDDSAILKVYEWTIMHEKAIHAQVLGKRGFSDSQYFEAYSHFRPDLQHIEVLIRDEINSACRRQLTHEIERIFQISTTTKTHHHQHQTTHKSTAAPVRRTTHAHPQTTTKRPTPEPTTRPTTTTTTRETTTAKTTVPTTMRRETTKQTTKATPPQTTQMKTDSTTTMPIVETTTNQYKVCSALSIVTALANGDTIQSPRAGLCTDGSHSQSEALLLNSCNTTDPKQWRQGPNVMANCRSIPTYTPIGTFTFGQYVMDGNSLSGIFIGCSEESFKMAVQLCGQAPQVFELKTTSSVARENAANYYIIDW